MFSFGYHPTIGALQHGNVGPGCSKYSMICSYDNKIFVIDCEIDYDTKQIKYYING